MSPLNKPSPQTDDLSSHTAESFLAAHDPLLGTLIDTHGHLDERERSDHFTSLARTIIGQQISVKAATTIFGRFEARTHCDPVAVASLSESDSKHIGLSGQKWSYLHNLATHFIEDSAIFDHLETLSDDDVIAELTRVKGIGVWSAQMFLMFTLGRPDVFAADDRGLQLAVEKLYERTFTRRELEQFATRWAPYRTTACLHLWRSLDNTPN